MAKRIQLRRDINSNWESKDPVLAQGEIGIDLSSKNFKIGDGQSTWTSLDYAIVSGKLGRVNADTFIETGDTVDDADTIYFVNEGDITVELTPALLDVYIASLFSGDIPSTNPYNGTIVVQGGVGISGDLNVGGDISANKIVVEEEVVSDLIGNVTGNVFGNLVGDIFNDTGAKILETGTSGQTALYEGNVNGNVNSLGNSYFQSATISSGTINGTIIGDTNPANITGVVVTATDRFEGTFKGKILGDVYADNGTTLILDNRTTGDGPTFYGTVVGTTAGDFRGDIYADNSTRKILENGRANLPSDPNYDPAVFYGNVNGNVSSTGVSTFSNIEVNGGRIDNTIIGENIPAKITGTTIVAQEAFLGQFQGVSLGPSTGDVLAADGTKILENGTDGTDAYLVGDVYARDGVTRILDSGSGGSSTGANFQPAQFTGNVVGDLTGDVTASNVDTGTLNTTDDVNIVGDLYVDGTGNFTGNITAPNLTYDGDFFRLSNNSFTVATATGDTSIAGDLTVGSDASIGGDLTVTGDIDVDNITANTVQSGTVTTTGNASIGDDLSVVNDASIGGNLNVTGTTSSNKFTGTTLEMGNIKISGNTIESILGGININTKTTSDYISISSKTIKATTDTLLGVSAFDLTGSVTVSGDVAINGGDITTTATSFNLATSNATTGNLLNVASTINLGTNATTASTITLGSPLSNNTVNIKSTTAGTVNLNSEVTTGTLNLFAGTTTGTVNLATGGASTTNIGGAGATLTVGKDTGNSTINLVGNTTAGSVTLSTNAATANVMNTNATTVNLAGAANTVNIGASLGATNVKHDLNVSGNSNILGNLSIAGDLSVLGALTYLDTTNTDIADNIITLNKGETSAGVTAGSSGIEIDRGTADSSWLKWNESTDVWEFGINGNYADLKVNDFAATGNVDIDGTLSVDENVTLAKDLQVRDISADNITTTGNITVGQDLSVSGDSQFTGSMIAGDITADNLTLNDNAIIGGTLDVTGLSTLATVDINGGNIDNTKIGETTPETIKATDIEANNLVIKNYGEIRLREAETAGFTYVGLRAPNEFVDSYTLTLPAVKGIDGNILALNTNGDKLEFVSADLFGGGQVAVSSDYGDDLNDGINKPVKTIKRALQIASGLVYDATGKINEKRLVVAVASGEYYEDNPIIIPDNVSVVGAGLRACNIRPLNNGKDMLRVRNGCYFTEITFRDALDTDKKPTFTFDYAVAFDDPSDAGTSRVGYTNLPTTKPTITISPYIQNCSIISFLGGNGVLVDGRKVFTPNIPKNPIEVESPDDFRAGIPQQGKSMVANAFTMLSFGGTGWRVINDAYAQIVSCFQIFCLNGSYCQSGGYLSITNSATNFGQFALRASGYSPNAFDFNRGYVIGWGTVLGGQDTVTAIGFKELPTQHYVLRFRDPSYRQAYDIINANKEELVDDLETWINAQITAGTAPFTTNFTYDVAKCKRDAKIILEAVAYDVLSGGNSKTVEAGLSYAIANATLITQKEENKAAFERLRDQTIPLIAVTLLSTYVTDKFNIVIDTLDDPTTAPDSIEYSNISDITAQFKDPIPNNEISFDASQVNPTTNAITFVDPPGHGLINMTKVDYSNNGNANIPGLDDEQSYYVDVISSSQLRLWTDESKTKQVDIRAVGTGTHKLIKNRKEYFIDDLISYHNDYQKLTLPSNSYTFIAGREIYGTTAAGAVTIVHHAYVFSWDPTTRELIISIDTDAQSPNFSTSTLITGDHSGVTIPGGIPITATINLEEYYTARFKILSTFGGATIANKPNLIEKQIWLHRPSIVNSSGHTWEYAGSGIDYNALPQNGGRTRVEYEQVSDIPGRVYSSGTNELGDFKVGDFIKAENKTGNVQFTNTVSIAELDALKLSIGNIQINEFSADIDLGDNEPGGPKDTRLSTQKAVRSFLENRLGFFIDREVSTNNLAGAVPQLNSLGLLSPDVIPPIRNFLVFKTNGYLSRLSLLDAVPANSVLPGDLSTETYSTVELRLVNDSSTTNTNKITGNDGDLITQPATGAQGYLVGSVIDSRIIQVASKDKLFSVFFNKTDPIVKNSVTYTLDATQPNLVVNTDQATNYILSEQEPSQFLVLDPTQTYDFTGVNPVTGAVSKAQGYVDSTNFPPTGVILGVIRSVDNLNRTNGSGYTDGTYTGVSLTGGSGTGAKGDFTIISGSVSTFDITRGGSGYTTTDTLSATLPLAPGGLGGFSIDVLAIENRLYVNNVGGVKFTPTLAVPDFIQDANASFQTLTTTDTIVKTFNAVTGVDVLNNRITITNHGLLNGDPVLYNSNGQSEVGGLGQGPENGFVYYVKYIDANTIELYSNYALLAQQKVSLVSTGVGTQQFILSSLDTVNNTVYLPSHGYTTGTSVRITGADLPSTIDDGKIYYVGSVTTNSFTLHEDKTEADNSVINNVTGGVTQDPVELLNKGTGTMTFTRQNIKVIGATSTSSRKQINWANLSANNIAANNIISGIISPTRLGNGQANDQTFLRGDSTYARVVQNIVKPANSALLFTGPFNNTGTELQYYDSINMDVDVVSGDVAAATAGPNSTTEFTNLGVAKFKRSQFDVGSIAGNVGQVVIRDGVIDAGTLDGQDGTYYTDPTNLTSPVPVNKGGTGIGDPVQYAIGDILYASDPQILTRLTIGANNTIMVSNGSTPFWTGDLVLNSLVVNGTVDVTGAASTLNAYDIKMDDNNIELGSVEPILGRQGVVNYTGGGSLQTEVQVPLTNGGTGGMIAGMILSKVSGAGDFGNNPRVLSIDSATQFTCIADTIPTSGAITFNVGGATDDTANNGGITLKSTVNKTLSWSKSTGAWTSSENMNLANGKTYMINNITVLSSNTVLGKELSSDAGKIMTSGSTWVRTFAFMGV